MNRLRALLILLSVVLFSISCSEDVLQEYDNSSSGELIKSRSIKDLSGYCVIDGVLHFDSLEVITSLVDQLTKMSDEELFEWERSNNFYSLYHAVLDAEDDIFSDSLLFESKLKKYKNLVYLDNDDVIRPYITAPFYQLLCNDEGYFYLGDNKHKITPKEVIVENPKLRSVERCSYITKKSMQPREEDIRFPLGTSSWSSSDRRVTVNVIYLRNIVMDKEDNWVGQQILHIWTEAYKKVLGKFRLYKTLHTIDLLGFYCWRGVYKIADGVYGTRTVRYEAKGAGGSVGEIKKYGINFYLSPANEWIPERLIRISDDDIYFIQVRAKTRGTGDYGAVINQHMNMAIDLPFMFSSTGDPMIMRDLVIENV